MITVTFEIYPRCQHVEFNSQCIWCADTKRIAREANKKLQELTDLWGSKIVIVKKEDSQDETN